MMASRNSGRGRSRCRKNRDRCSIDQGRPTKTAVSEVNDSSSVLKVFRGFQKELDNRNDRHERIVKLSRDITIESKKLIFLLQRIAGSEDKQSLLSEAAEKLHELHTSKFLALANELDGQDPFQFLRAFSPGLQEYIEAVTFYHYLADKKLICMDKVQSMLTFIRKNREKPQDSVSDVKRNTSASITEGINQQEVTSESQTVPSSEEHVSSSLDVQNDPQLNTNENKETISVPVPPSEYILGVADFTGELMRMAINSVGSGDLDTPTIVTETMRIIYDAFSTFANTPRELRQKTKVLHQSLQKVETACYTLKVRGTEIPKHMLADVFTNARPAPNDLLNAEELYD